MSRDELLALAERVEALTGPDREIDGAITLAIFPWVGIDEYGDFVRADGSAYDGVRIRVLEYTASIDAALTLVPKGHIWTLYSDGCAGVEPRGDDPEELADGTTWAATPALALTAAALRAQAVLMEGRDG